jgi:hypothetical protein
VTGRRPYEEDFDEGEKGYQGENGDLKNRDGVKINHMDIPMGDMDKNESTYADSSIGEGMDITIQGVNGHRRREDRWVRVVKKKKEKETEKEKEKEETDPGQDEHWIPRLLLAPEGGPAAARGLDLLLLPLLLLLLFHPPPLLST